MIEFIPHTLENEIIDMLNKLDFLEGEIDGISFDDIKNKNAYESFDEQEITEKSEIYLEIGEDSYPLVTIKFLREIIGEWDSAKMNSTQSYAKSFNKAYFLLKIDDYDDCSFIDTILKSNNSVVKKEDVGRCLWNNSIVVDNKTYEVSLYNGICLYHLLVRCV